MRKRWISGGVAAALLVGGGVTGGVWWANRGPDYPDQWDSRVTALVDYVQEERGLEFKHPVYVDFLSDEEFDKEVTSEDGDLSDEDRKDIDDTTGLLRALGFVGPKFDLLESLNETNAGGILGLYSHEDKRVRVRGTELTPAVKSTLAHELTHVLQDQYFDLGARLDSFGEDDAKAEAWRALVEGDANRIEEAWEDQLSPSQKKALDKSEKAQQDTAEDKLSEVPVFLQTIQGAPYAFGGALLQFAVAMKDDTVVDELFADPPSTEEHLLDPWTLLRKHEAGAAVPKPGLEDGEEEFDSGTFGAYSLMFMLAERIDPAQALRAADGWGGDSYVAYRSKDRSCMRLDYRGDDATQTAELKRALDAWIAAGPRGTASVRSQAKELHLDTCDPGAKAVKGTGGSAEAMNMAVGRTYLTAEAIRSGNLQPAVARCVVRGLVDHFGIEKLVSKDPQADVDRGELRAIHEGCGLQLP